MTASALDFVTPLTFATLSRNPVLTEFHDEKTGEWNSHVDLGIWADLFLIAPASANTISKMSHGFCDNLLTATYLSARCPVYIVPAMDADMYQHPSTIDNLNKLSSYGNKIIDAPYGELASGLQGEGRMAEPEDLLKVVKELFKKKVELKGFSVLVTAGPTQERIDPVRFISNYSSGKMGYALADILADRGAEVNLISGPVNQKISHPRVRVIPVITAIEMYEKCTQLYDQCDIAIFSAAVADYRPAEAHSRKIKKSDLDLMIPLKRNPDIAYELGKMKKKNQINIGFALETDNEIANAALKLNEKNFDFIVLNSLKDPEAGFTSDKNKITIIDRSGKKKKFPLKSKVLVAEDIVDFLVKKLNAS
jgi:phosphopantothenoylcysteine decarboxylase/phosphopantothenate--cysteine ligase